MTVVNSITERAIPADVLSDLFRSMRALKELADLTPSDDSNSLLLQLVATDLESSCNSLLRHLS